MPVLSPDDHEVLYVALESRAAWFAAGAHGAQLHGTRRHRHHLEDVREVVGLVCRQVGMLTPSALRQAAWLHDVLSDTPISEKHLRELFTRDVIELVATLTARGGNKRSQMLTRSRHLRESPWLAARVLAIAERIAEVRGACSTSRLQVETYLETADDFGVSIALEVAHGFRDDYMREAYEVATSLLDVTYNAARSAQ